jgi:hypothetical protein
MNYKDVRKYLLTWWSFNSTNVGCWKPDRQRASQNKAAVGHPQVTTQKNSVVFWRAHPSPICIEHNGDHAPNGQNKGLIHHILILCHTENGWLAPNFKLAGLNAKKYDHNVSDRYSKYSKFTLEEEVNVCWRDQNLNQVSYPNSCLIKVRTFV